MNKTVLSKYTQAVRPEAAYKVLAQVTDLEKKGAKIIHFEIGQPDFPTPKHICDAGISAIKKGFTRYSSVLGIMPLREAISKNLNETRDIHTVPQNIAITPSGKTAIFTAMSAVLNKGDEVIYPNPSFPTYEIMTEYLGCVKKPIPLLEKNSFSFDMKIFRKKFSKKTKLIILNSPSNPTGGIMPMKDLKEIAETVKNTACWIMTDEMYGRIIYDNMKYPSFYSLKNMHDRTILIDGFSKVYSMTGWRIGYISAPVRIMDKIDNLLTHICAGTATFTQYAALAGLTGPQKELNNMVKEFEKRRDFVVKTLNSIKGVSCTKPEGAFYAFPNIKAFKKSSQWIADYLLKEARISVLAGTCFGKYGEGYLRMSYATSMENLTTGLFRLKKALDKLIV